MYSAFYLFVLLSWSSSDGVTWTLENFLTNFPPRYCPSPIYVPNSNALLVMNSVGTSDICKFNNHLLCVVPPYILTAQIQWFVCFVCSFVLLMF